MSHENPLLSDSTEKNQEEQPEEGRRRVDPDVAEAVRILSQEKNELDERVEKIVEENNELRERVEMLQEKNDELRERLEQVEEDNQKLREEKADSERVSALEGDYTCPSCSRHVYAEDVTELYQEETEGGILGSTFDGPVTEVRCPNCDEKTDITEELGHDDRVQLTNKLRDRGVATGEKVPVEDTADDGEVEDVE